MIRSMREQLIKALIAHAHGDIQKHAANVEVYLNNPVGIGEHSNIIEAIEQELDMIAKYQDQIDIINKYFKNLMAARIPRKRKVSLPRVISIVIFIQMKIQKELFKDYSLKIKELLL